jgi:UDP-N-acetylglucosamine 2-epimerase
MRDLTERTEGAASGMVHLIGPHRERIVSAVAELLERNPGTGAGGDYYGDGHAAMRILDNLFAAGERA